MVVWGGDGDLFCFHLRDKRKSTYKRLINGLYCIIALLPTYPVPPHVPWPHHRWSTCPWTLTFLIWSYDSPWSMGGSESGLIQRWELKRPYLFSILRLCHYHVLKVPLIPEEVESWRTTFLWLQAATCPAEFQTLYRLTSLGIVCYTTGVNNIVHKQALGYKIKVWLWMPKSVIFQSSTKRLMSESQGKGTANKHCQ